MRFGALEAGGTKMVMAILDENASIIQEESIPTSTPSSTMPLISDFFRSAGIEALGIGSFGPVDLNRISPSYGHITSTPKQGWTDYDIVGFFQRELSVPIGFDTDVNAAVLGEATYGTLKGLSSGIYITVGTGIGVGVYINGSPLHGMLHPEAGHILLNKHPQDSFKGICPFHSNCLEGLASGPALEKRYHKKAIELTGNSMAWDIEAYYLAQGIVTYILTLSPERIVMGGGVMHQKQLFPLIHSHVDRLLNHYIQTPQTSNLKDYIVPSALNGKQGILGCLRLAKNAMETLFPGG